MASAGEDVRILSLDQVTCSLIFLDVPRKGDWRKEKQRTLTLTKNRGQSQGDCILEVFDKKHKLLLKQSVTFCGILLYSTQIICKKKLEVRQCLDMLFTQVTAIIVFKEDPAKAKDTHTYCWRRCQEWFGHVITKCVDLASHPPSSVFLDGCSQVLFSLTSSRLTLCSTSEPHTSLVTWLLERLLPKLDGDILNVVVEGEGSYKFTSRVDKKWVEDVNRSMREYLHLDHTYLEPVSSPPPGACQVKNDPLYLELTDELICEKCRQLYRTYFESGDDDWLDSYSIDLNEYVQMRKSLYKRVVGTVCDVESSYITTCTYKGSNNQESPKQQENYIEIEAKKGTVCDVESSYITTCTYKGGNNQESPKQQENYIEIEGKKGDTIKDKQDEISVKVTRDDELSLEVKQRSVPNLYKIDYSLPDKDQQQVKHSESVSEEETSDSVVELLETLRDVLFCRPPRTDTLQLPRLVRFQLCIKLYQKSAKTVGTCMEDWQLFGDIIGLTAEAVNLISIIVKNHSLPHPAGELVLRHWQYMFNTYGQTGEAGRCPYACNKENLVKILHEIGREDLVELIENSERS